MTMFPERGYVESKFFLFKRVSKVEKFTQFDIIK